MAHGYWAAHKAVNGALSGAFSVTDFMLSADPPEKLAPRLTDLFEGRGYYPVMYYQKPLWDTSALTPHNRHTIPSNLELSVAGTVRLRWGELADQAVYPALDELAASPEGPVRSFAAWIYDYALHVENTYLYGKLSDYSRGGGDNRFARLWVVGTVGPHGSGADLELEGIGSWRPGYPLYIPGNQLEFPLELVHGVRQPYQPAPVGYPLLETEGPFRNIAQVGLNGLTEGHFTASAGLGYHAFSPGGDWRTTQGDGYGQWVEVDFGRVVEGITGFSLTASGTHSPKTTSLLVSDDGVDYTEAARHVFGTYPARDVVWMDAPVNARHVRFHFIDRHYAGSYYRWVELEQVEVYQAGSW